MRPYLEGEGLALYLGDCREVMAAMEPESVDAIVTDPPYELAFMAKSWDAAGVAFDPETWRAALRVAKPGAHLLAFGAPRTYHRLAVAIEDAGWEVRDCLVWMFGSGFPKSLNLDGEWEGWGTALKPAYEPVILARKPLRGTVAANVTAYGTGALNIDGCRIGTGKQVPSSPKVQPSSTHTVSMNGGNPLTDSGFDPNIGRWPANIVIDEAAAELLDATVGERVGGGDASIRAGKNPGVYGAFMGGQAKQAYGDSGGPSRFFYTAKASRSEREAGLEDMPPVRRSDGREKDIENPRLRTTKRRNHHPTVKPVALMAWLVRLVTPPGGVVLDPFMGSGSTRIAAQQEAKRFIGIELDPEYIEIAARRVAQHGLEIA